MVCKPVHRVRTPCLFGQKEIVPLEPPIIIIQNSTQKKSALSLADLGIHDVMQPSKHILKMRKSKDWKSSFMLHTSTILETLLLSVYHLIVCPLKGHSQLWGRANLDTSFSHFEKSSPQPEIKVHLVIAVSPQVKANKILDRGQL